jgi:broad specificity phosphatase PhoE
MTTFYLIRHAEPDWAFKNARNLRGALRDYVPLTASGMLQAEQIAEKHPCLQDSELIISSPFTRSMHTAAIINRQLALPFLVEYDLHEWIPDNFEEVELGSVHPYVMERE